MVKDMHAGCVVRALKSSLISSETSEPSTGFVSGRFLWHYKIKTSSSSPKRKIMTTMMTRIIITITKTVHTVYVQVQNNGALKFTC